MNASTYTGEKENWWLKYKLYHIPFWFAYHIMWWMVTIGSISGVTNNILFSAYSIKFLFYVIFQALGVYFNLYYLIPTYLEKGKYLQYVSCVVITIICMAAFITTGYYAGAWLSGNSFMDMYGISPSRYFYFFQVNTLPSSAASMTLAMSVKLTRSWIQTKKREQVLEKEKLETELNFLRHQFNPHFLFNTINSIFFLIHKNPDMASASLAKFSELLRYQLYECNDKQILLSREIAYLENSIELEKLRQNDNVVVSFQSNHREDTGLEIAPFILMTFVENAFKHVSKHTDQPNWIKIKLQLSEDRLNFYVSNSTSTVAANDLIRYGGIGLKNVQRRLDLIYPGRYDLNIENNDAGFEVRLQLDLSEQLMPQRMQKTALY